MVSHHEQKFEGTLLKLYFQPSYVDLIAALESKSGDEETMSEYATAWGRK